MSSIAPDRLLVTPIIAPTTPSTPGWRLTAEEAATAVAGLKQAAAGWAALLAECAGLAGVAATSASDAWATGDAASNGPDQALALRCT